MLYLIIVRSAHALAFELSVRHSTAHKCRRPVLTLLLRMQSSLIPFSRLSLCDPNALTAFTSTCMRLHIAVPHSAQSIVVLYQTRPTQEGSIQTDNITHPSRSLHENILTVWRKGQIPTSYERASVS